MRRRALYVSLLVAAALLVLAVAAVRLRTPRGPVFHAQLSAAPGLREGASVSFRGVPVGIVSELRFAANAVCATITLTRTDVPLREGDGVRVGRGAAFGTAALELVPTMRPGGPVGPGAVLPEVPADPETVRQDAVRAALMQRAGVTMEIDSVPAGAAAARAPREATCKFR